MIYQLKDLYVIFKEAKTREEKADLLKVWAGLNLPYDLNWGGLFKAWS